MTQNLGKVEGKRRFKKKERAARWIDSVTEVMGAPLEDLKKVGERLSWRKSS